jgi:acyl-coenzyme A synthetase/AMP-(fatty) acid ligase
MHIVDMVHFWARSRPQHPAIIQPDGIVTYGALAQAIESAAEYFTRNIGDTSKPVTVSLPSAAKMLIASLGLLRAAFDIIVATTRELAHVRSADSNTLVYERGGTTLSDRTNIVFDESWIELGAGTPRLRRPLIKPTTRDTNIFFFTSGTTGRPKLAVRTQKAWDQRVLFNLTAAFADYKRVLVLAGLTTSIGFATAYEALYAGKTACFAPPGLPMLWLANTYDIDLMVASPGQALVLAELQQKSTRYPLAALKTIRLGGAAASADGIRRIKNHLCRNVVMTYASTEAGFAAIAPHDMIAHIPNAAGFVIPGTAVQIIDAEGNVLPAGSEGLVRLRTPLFLQNLPIENPNAWFYPGDVGWLTEEGVLCIAGRKGDVLNRGGDKLSVTDFEEFLRSCPGVKDAGICGVMGVSGREEVWIGLVLEPAADIGALRAKIEADAIFSSNIDKLFVVDAIPRGSLGKIQRDDLKRMLLDLGDEPDVSS